MTTAAFLLEASGNVRLNGQMMLISTLLAIWRIAAISGPSSVIGPSVSSRLYSNIKAIAAPSAFAMAKYDSSFVRLALSAGCHLVPPIVATFTAGASAKLFSGDMSYTTERVSTYSEDELPKDVCT